MWFDAGELSRASGLKFPDSATGAAMAAAKRTEHRCPSCAIPLYEREIDKGAGIFMDQCPNCAGLFADRDEFSRTRCHFVAKGAAKRPTTPADREQRETVPQVDEDSVFLQLFQYLTSLPIEVDAPQTLFPPAVTFLILANVVVLVLAMVGGLEEWIDRLGLVPAKVMHGDQVYTFLTAMFMHGGVLHLLGNMYFLYITGDNVEERFGWHWFLAFYLFCGVVAGAADVVGRMGSTSPAVGASGAVAGVLGAYVVLFPQNRFLCRWLLGWRYFWRPVYFEMPVYGYLGFWIVFQVIFALLDVPGIGWWAHIGGFACGACIAAYVRLRDKRG
jgi:membrane associated rhomboid family serine protease